jgi:hypothetical protein
VEKNSVFQEETAQRIIREFGLVQGTRGTFESHWQEVAERIWPGMSWKFNPYWYTTPGAKKNQNVFDSTASLALNRFGAILDSLLTPRNQTWHTLAATDKSLNKQRDVHLWFEDVTKILFHQRYLTKANFASQNQQNYKSLGAFGSGCLFIDGMKQVNGVQSGLRYKTVGLGEIYFVENHQGVVDKAFRYFDLTVRQAVQKWGDKLPENIRKAGESNPEQIFHFIHLVEPREEVDFSRKDFKGMEYASYYVSKEETKLIEEGGFKVFPYAISRYEQYPGEVYGRSPAMDLLPAIKTLNEEKKTMLKQGQRIVDPVLLAHDDGVVDAFSLKPGAINAGGVTADGRPLVHALPTGNLAMGKELMDDERQLINDGFLVSLFQILTESPQMTATEVLERTREKGILLAPTIGRQQSEYLGPMIERELDILAQQGLLPPMPMALKEAKGQFQIVYDSPLTRAQRADEASGLMRTVESVLNVVNVTQDPSPLFHFNWDAIVPDIAEIQGVPFHWMNSKEVVAAQKQQKAQQAQNQNMIQGAPGAAAMMNAATKAQGKG